MIQGFFAQLFMYNLTIFKLNNKVLTFSKIFNSWEVGNIFFPHFLHN